MDTPHTPNGNDRAINEKRIEDTSSSFFGFFVNRRKTAILLTLIITMWGLFSLFTLPREANPEVKIPIAVVSTVWPGASPEDVEEQITDEIESKLKNLDNLAELSSSSSNSLSSITVEFEASADLDKSIRELRDAVDTVTDLPDEITDRPRVIEVSINDDAIISFSLIGNLNEVDMKLLAERVQDEIESISGVSEAQIVGDRDREWNVSLNPGRLAQLNISANDVTRAISQANITIPLGTIDIDNKLYNLRSRGEVKTLEALGSVVVAVTPSGTVLLRDVADINDQLVERTSLSRLAQAGETPKNTLSLQVYKQTGGNIINIVDAARSSVEQMQESGVIPSNVDVVATNDMSQFIRDDFGTLTRSGVQTLVLIFVSLALVLALRMALIAVVSIPIIFLMSFGIIDAQGSTLNSLTLFSLVLSLGLLIDTTIILLEGIYEGVNKGYSRKEAALLSIAQYKWPITAGVLTTIAAFIPMLLVEGIVGEFLKTLPLTIGAVLGSSLVVGLLIMPGLSTYIIKGGRVVMKKNKLQKRLYRVAKEWYRPSIRKLLEHKKSRRKLNWSITGIFVLCFALLGTGIIKTELFPQSDFDFMFINIELEQGSVLEDTERVAAQVEAVVKDIDGLDNYLTTIGRSAAFGIGASGSSREHLASITATLKDASERSLKSYEISRQLRQDLAHIPGADITVEDVEGGPPSADPIGIQVRGSDLATLSRMATDIKVMLATIDGVEDISSSDKPSPPQFVFDLDHELLGQYGLNAAQVSSELRTALFGADVGTVTVDGEDIDIIVEYNEVTIQSVDDVRNIEVVNPRGDRIKVSRVADVRVEPALQTIQHRDTERAVFISARNEGRSIPEIQSEINEKVKAINVPDGHQIIQAGEFEDQNAAFYDLYRAMGIAVLLIFLIMVLQFNSFKQPFVILLTLPLAFVGVILGTFLFGMPFGFPTFLGVVALAGIVVNDAIVLIDRINVNIRTRGMHIDDAVAEAGEARLQPIILTTTTTALGVIPLAFADEFWRGLSVAIATGIIFATALTLFVIPLLYRRFEYKTFLKEYPNNTPKDSLEQT